MEELLAPKEEPHPRSQIESQLGGKGLAQEDAEQDDEEKRLGQ